MKKSNVKQLNPLQKAYLLGRSEVLPLGGFAMHDFREFHGNIASAKLQQAIDTAVLHTPALRTIIDDVNLTQYEYDAIASRFEIIDLSSLSIEQANDQLHQIRRQYSTKTHSLSEPLWSICLVQLPEGLEHRSVVLTSFDGLILDGFSISKLLSNLFSDSDAILEKTPDTTDKIPAYFLNKPQDKQYWEKKVASFNGLSCLPWKTDLNQLFAVNHVRQGIIVDKTQWSEISRQAAKYKLLPNVVLTAIILEQVAKFTQEQYLLISMPVSDSSLSNKIANSSSFIVIDYDVRNPSNFIDRAKKLQSDILYAMSHISFSGIEIAKLLIKKYAKTIVLPVAFTNGLSWGNAFQTKELFYHSGLARTPQLALDIRVSLSRDADIEINFDYCNTALDDGFIQRILEQIQSEFSQFNLAEQVKFDQNRSNITANQHTKNEIQVHDYLADLMLKLQNSQNKIALIFDQKKISYKTLASNVAKLQQAFRQRNLGRSSVVAICLHKSPEHIYTTLACTLLGIIWVPIDMASPIARINYLLSNCGADLVVSESRIENFPYLDIQQVLQQQENYALISDYVIDETPAYYLYTSGSTGMPKCVVLNQLATANVVQQTIARWQMNEHDVCMGVTPFHHDMSVFDIFGSLSIGATLVLPTPQDSKNAMAWAQLVSDYKITIWVSVPAIVDMLLMCAQPHQIQSLRLIAQGGDFVKPKVIQNLQKLIPAIRLFSLGGPTETTIWSIWHEITHQDQDIIPYGKALKNNDYCILNPQYQPCAIGDVGSICMSGINLANGYLIDGKLSDNDFIYIKDNVGQSLRLYKSSDKGYLRADGNIIFVGRDEGYLKVKGVRISAFEVENKIAEHYKIQSIVILACFNPIYDGNELVAIYTSNFDQAIDILSIKNWLKQELPVSHIPTRWIKLSELPLTRNGKIDRKQLHELVKEHINFNHQDIVKTITEDSTPKQSRQNSNVFEILCELPVIRNHTENIVLDSHIISVGIRIKQLNEIAKHFSKQFNISVDVNNLAKCQTIHDIVEYIEKQI
ncbi:AMP-binding protein [Acinetobacter qingfengensis]|uniref:Uncharacterized protein n=1 Tax=Acinetobacter qingfengensis TaxID=1262585 RepID=A0A1E7R8F3_9GAMM|nr:AMP-binding protein [Acinetobacter qingfengensis]KAA8734712.1 AMP-binding protein [Acinetobacter qingfengensis]OEY95533.1 hypothetical protein BJI46_12725 [Acinetobacter qingfengensis]